MDSTYRVRKRSACADPSPAVKRTKREQSPGDASPVVVSKSSFTPASTRGRGLSKAADTCTPSKPPLPRHSLQAAAVTCAPKEVLGSRKSIRRGKLPLPAKYDLLLQLFGALQLVFKVNKMRGHLCIFQAAKLAVEQQSGRRFMIGHLAQMKSVYPEIFSLRYANIPKTTVEGQPSGVQLIIDMSLSDTAAEPMSTARPTAPTQSASRFNSHNARLDGASATTAAPSSTQAVFKAGSTAVTGHNSIALESVSKRVVCGSAAVTGHSSTAPGSVSKRAVSSDAVTVTGSRGLESVGKAGSSDSKQGIAGYVGAVAGQSPSGAVDGQSPSGAVAAQSPGEPVRMLAVKAEFERRLEKQVLQHYQEFLQVEGDAAAVAAPPQQWQADFDLEAVPEIPQAALPPQPPKAVFGLGTPGTAAKTPFAGGQSPMAPRDTAPGARRLSFEHLAGAERDPASDNAPQQLTDEQVVQQLPEELRRQSLSGALPFSLQALRAVSAQQAQREVMFSADAKAARRRSAANAMLPRAFDTLRAYFGASGSAVKPYDEVVKQLTNSNKGAGEAAQVEDQLALLAEVAPECLTLDTNLDGKKIVRLQRRVDNKAIRQRLVQMSGKRV